MKSEFKSRYKGKSIRKGAFFVAERSKMIKLKLQHFGGRGASSSSGNSTFTSESDFEKSLNGVDDPRLKEYSDSLKEENAYNQGLKNVLDQVIGEDGFEAAANTIDSEIKTAQKELDSLPKKMTPAQLGKKNALSERIDILNQIKEEKKNVKGSGRGNVDIV